MSELSSDSPEVSLSALTSEPITEVTTDVISCPPPAERSPASMVDPRSDLLAVAATLTRTRNHRLLIDYLRLRRAAR